MTDINNPNFYKGADFIGGSPQRFITTDVNGKATDADYQLVPISVFGGLVTGDLIQPVGYDSSLDTAYGLIDSSGVGGFKAFVVSATTDERMGFSFVDRDTLNTYYVVSKSASNQTSFTHTPNGEGVDTTGQLSSTVDGIRLSATGARVNEFSTDGTLAGNSDTAVPTEKAVKTYVDTTQAYEEYVLNPSGTQAGRVYTSLTDCIAAINAAGNPKSRITLTENVTTSIPANTNMNNITLAGNGTGVLLGGLLLTITGGSMTSWAGARLESLGIAWASSDVMITVSGQFTMVLDAGSAFLRAGSAHMFDVTASGAFLITACLGGSIIIGSAFGGSPITDVGANGTWVIAMAGSGTNVDNDIVTGTASGAGKGVQYVFSDAAPELDCYTTTQSAFTGGRVFQPYSKYSNIVSTFTIHTAPTLAISFHHTVRLDASSNAITVTLPNATLFSTSTAGRELILIGYDATNTITINTTSSQDIRRDVSDVGNTSTTLAQGDILKLIAINLGSGNGYWQVTS